MSATLSVNPLKRPTSETANTFRESPEFMVVVVALAALALVGFAFFIKGSMKNHYPFASIALGMCIFSSLSLLTLHLCTKKDPQEPLPLPKKRQMKVSERAKRAFDSLTKGAESPSFSTRLDSKRPASLHLSAADKRPQPFVKTRSTRELWT